MLFDELGSSKALVKLAKELANIVRKYSGGLMGSVVTPHIIGFPLHDVLVIALGEATDRLEVVGEASQPNRYSGRACWMLSPGVLVVQADR